MKINFDKFDLSQLEKLKCELERAIIAAERREKKVALLAAEEAAKLHGYSLSELAGELGGQGRQADKSSKSGLSAKYANPNNPLETWSGRGRRPRWFVDALEAGRKEEDLLI